MNAITARDAALIQRRMLDAALDVARQEWCLERLREIAATDRKLQPLVKALDALEDRALPMLVCDMEVAA